MKLLKEKQKEKEKLKPEEVQEKLLKVTIANNKRLKSIDFTLSFIGFVVLFSILIAILSFFF